jgi:hypothetical protein
MVQEPPDKVRKLYTVESCSCLLSFRMSEAGLSQGKTQRDVAEHVYKSCPATCHRGTRGDRRYSSCSFLTSTLDGGEWSASRPGRALPPRKEPPVPIEQEAGWAPEPVWTQGLEEKSSDSAGSNPDRPARSQTLH